MSFEPLRFEGKRLEDLAALAGHSISETRKWLNDRGYTAPNSIVRKVTHPAEIQDGILRQIASAPVHAPCFRCGCRSCECQSPLSTVRGLKVI